MHHQCCKYGGTEVDGVHLLIIFEGARRPPRDRVSAWRTGVHPRPYRVANPNGMEGRPVAGLGDPASGLRTPPEPVRVTL